MTPISLLKTFLRALVRPVSAKMKQAHLAERPGFPKGPEDRESLYIKVLQLAHDRGLHVAPAVPLGAVFSVRNGRKENAVDRAERALAHDRVDILLLDRCGKPLIAMDYLKAGSSIRIARKAKRIKDQLFERAELPLIILGGPGVWEKDLRTINHKLSLVLGEVPQPSKRKFFWSSRRGVTRPAVSPASS